MLYMQRMKTYTSVHRSVVRCSLLAFSWSVLARGSCGESADIVDDPPGEIPSGLTAGKTTIGHTQGSVSANIKRAVKVTLTQVADVSSVSVYLKGNGSSSTQGIK